MRRTPRWITPTVDGYLDGRDAFFDAFGGRAFDHGAAYVANDGQAVALWLPPGVTPDIEAMIEMTVRSVGPGRMEELGALFEQMDHYHPKMPVWYLPVIATDPAHQGQGLGAAIMAESLKRIDAERMPAYLESSNPRNVPFYERFGFRAIGEIQAGSSPVMTPMYREAQ